MREMQAKNRAPAAIQITAEQLLREAKERGLEDVEKAPTQFITDKEELLQYQAAKRKDFEDQLRRNRQHIGIWCRYALWEASLSEFERSRSVFERAADVDYRSQTVWLKYAEMEMKNKFINHARNIWDRSVTLLPRMDVFWYKYTYMEEMVGAIDAARQVFERWMQWEPDDQAWGAYVKFEMRQGEIAQARAVYERYTECHPTSRAYLKYARWEEKQYQFGLARSVYERSLNEVHHDERSEQLLIHFARFEERSKEYDRARVIYKYALEHIGKVRISLSLPLYSRCVVSLLDSCSFATFPATASANHYRRRHPLWLCMHLLSGGRPLRAQQGVHRVREAAWGAAGHRRSHREPTARGVRGEGDGQPLRLRLMVRLHTARGGGRGR